MLAEVKILPSNSLGSGMPGVEPLTPAEIAADLKAQSVDVRSALRQALPSLTHATTAEGPLGGAREAGSSANEKENEQEDILRNFSEELQMVALFCKAPATEANLASFSKQVELLSGLERKERLF